jgi:WD40 repeat protein
VKTVSVRPVVLFLAFANDWVSAARHLRHLAEEQRMVREKLGSAKAARLCEVDDRANVTVAEVLAVLQDAAYRNRIAVFHFSGHAGSFALLLETLSGAPAQAHAGGLAQLLAEQHGLQLVFLNGCSTLGQVKGLLDAGVPAVIATAQSFPDQMAAEFSIGFYGALGSGASIQTSYNEAQAAVRFAFGPDEPGGELWGLYTAPGAEEAIRRWSLPIAARDPLFGLPAPPAVDLPRVPFKHLAYFAREDAPVFFGRGREIRELFDSVSVPDGAPIVLLFGASGAGKSSLLAAGLLPRLEPSHDVLYLRRERTLGAARTLSRALAPNSEEVPPGSAAAAAWHGRERARSRPLVVILDQLEEIWSRPIDPSAEVQELAAALRQLFAIRGARPLGRLVLSFRKEWLAEVLAILDAARLPRASVEVTHPNRDAIQEVVSGLTSRPDLKRQYRLAVEDELPREIASDLLEDPGAAVAPVLQILLTRMWAEANRESSQAPRFSIELYLRMKSSGILLDDFLNAQLEALRAARPADLESGLALDLLAFHTTPLGTAETRLASEVMHRYAPAQEVAGLLENCRERFLLVAAGQTSRLAHDLLAPLIHRRFESSNLPGQQALRILEQRAGAGVAEAPLDDFDLSRVEAGRRGMRAFSAEEEALVALSRRQAGRRRRQRSVLRLAFATGAAVLFCAALLASWQRRQALASEQRARDRELAALAANLAANRPTEAALVLLEIPRPDETPTSGDILRRTLAEPLTLAILSRHTRHVMAASFSPDGQRIVTASLDKSARIWNAATGELQATLAGHEGGIWAAAFSPDGSRVATASLDHTARIWSVASGRLLAVLIGHRAAVWAVSFSPDGRRVVTASWDKTARIWEAATGKLVATLDGHSGEVWAASFSPDGNRIATASLDHTARLWNAATGNPICILAGHADEVSAAEWSSDGARVVTASWDKTARIWDATRCRSIASLHGHSDVIAAASFSRDGRWIATASRDRTARIWNGVTGEAVATLAGHSDEVGSATFSLDGSRLLTASRDQTAKIWNTASSELVATLKGHTGGVTAASFSPDGTRALTASLDETARVWGLSRDEGLRTLTGHAGIVWDASWSSDGTRVVTASGDKSARIWSAAGQWIGTLSGHSDEVHSASFSPDGHRLVTASQDRTAWIWSAATGRPLAILSGHGRAVWGAAFSPDGRRAITASYDKTARIWDLASGEVAADLVGHTAQVRGAAFSADGRSVVTASFDHTARLWDAATGKAAATLRGHTAEVLAAAFSADSKRVVTASVDGTARIWSVDGGKPLAVLVGHSAEVPAAAFDASGDRVVTGSLDQTARIWNAATGQPIATLSGHTGGVWAASFSPDGAWVLTGSADATARIWPASGEYLQSRVRARTPLCLEARSRRSILGEDAAQAEARERACRICVPRFLARLRGAAAGDWRTHLTAWHAYRECLPVHGA